MRGHILIVEDDPDILSSLAEAIREEGFEVDTAAHGYQALTRGSEPLVLTPAAVDGIDRSGGTMLGTARGSQPPEEMVETP